MTSTMEKRYGRREVVAGLYAAFLKARKGKRKTVDENKFEIKLYENILQLADDVMSKEYSPGRGICFVTHRPVIREIFGAPFRDRVVHHFLCDVVMDWWDRHFIARTCSCRDGKGTKYAIEMVEKDFRSVSDNYKKETYYIKLDISGFFMGMNRRKLYERAIWGLDKQFPPKERGLKYQLCKFLWRMIIFDVPTEGVHRKGDRSNWLDVPDSKSLFKQPRGYGIVIGNLTSQLLSNILLDELDRYVTMELGYKHYVRYVDDFIITVPVEQKRQAVEDVAKIEKFLWEKLELRLHPKKRQVQEIHKGVEFVGARIYAGYKLPSKRVERNFYKAMKGYMRGDGRYKPESIMSYLGQMEQFKSRKIVRRGCMMVGIDYEGVMMAKGRGGNELKAFLVGAKEGVRGNN